MVETMTRSIESAKALAEKGVPWRFFYVVAILCISLFGWIYIDHFALSKTVVKVESSIENFSINQQILMRSMGIEPVRTLQKKEK